MGWQFRHSVTTTIHLTAYRAFQGKLLAARKAAGLTQAELAKRMKRPQSFVSKAEAGDRRLDIVEFIWLAQELGLKPEILVEELAADLQRSNNRRLLSKVWKEKT